MHDELLRSRIIPLNDMPATVGGGCVLYVMSRDQRIADNHALYAAQCHALSEGLPLAVLFALYPGSGYRALEHYEFMLLGLSELEASLKSLRIPLITLVGHPKSTLSAALHHYRPSAVYFDMNPLRGPRHLQKSLAANSDVPMYLVDTHNTVPLWVASPKQEVGAYTMRPKLHKLFATYLEEPERIIVPHRHEWKGPVRHLDELSENLAPLLSRLRKNGTAHGFQSGEQAAHSQLEGFIKERLERYAVDRNDPSTGHQSGLSPYLHFGQISALHVARRLREIAIREGDDLHFLQSPKMPQPTEAKTTRQYGIDSLIEEMVVRKELADNFCWYNASYDTLEAAPSWAKLSLDRHRSDPREHMYSYQALETAATHDEAWNAAQRQLIRSGKMHGYMRMYWAKKVLEWTENPEQAIDYLIRMNDFYSLDGGDPNGYAGILWSVAGVHDRPWFERPIFGVIRYMNDSGLKRKFDIAAYQKQWSDNV